MAITYTAWSTPANSTGDGYQWGWSFRVGVEVFQRSGGQVVVRCFAQERVVGILSQTFIYSGIRNVSAVLSVGGQTRQLNMQWQDVYLESPVGGEAVGEERMFGEYTFNVGTGAGTGHGAGLAQLSVPDLPQAGSRHLPVPGPGHEPAGRKIQFRRRRRAP